ncbi:MAG: hypothetical protein FWG38_04955, partial [Defluviitaleaceae bacterium]|nr:hypothetical protein [Defluviitaleaceae bacterium]
CTKVEVTLLPQGKVQIVDNGRGIPLSKDLHASQAVLEKILAGRPITNVEYSQMGDLTRAGLQAVNSLCETFQMTVYRQSEKFQQDYVRGIAQHELYAGDGTGISGIKIILKPDAAIFGETKFSQEILCAWLTENARHIPNLEFAVRVADV